MLELRLGRELVGGGLEAALNLLTGVGAAPDQPRVRSASPDGGAMKTCTASGIFSRT